MKKALCFLSGLVDLIDSDGGHLILLTLLVAMFQYYRAEAYLDLTIGALIMKLKDTGSNKGREAKYSPTDTTTTVSAVTKSTT